MVSSCSDLLSFVCLGFFLFIFLTCCGEIALHCWSRFFACWQSDPLPCTSSVGQFLVVARCCSYKTKSDHNMILSFHQTSGSLFFCSFYFSSFCFPSLFCFQIYLSFLLIGLAANCLSSCNVLLFCDELIRLPLEEHMLTESLYGYSLYSRRTARLIPYVY